MSFAIKKDKPIDSFEEDLLNRGEFAEQLAESIYNLAIKNENIVIGIEGPWGVGKTSLLHLIKKSVCRFNKKDNKKINIAWLNSWLCSDNESLVMEFFKNIHEGISTNGKCSVDIKDMGSLAQKSFVGGFKAFSFSKTVPTFDCEKLWNEVSKKSIQECKDSIVRKLCKDDVRPLIFFIDDIDRLTEEEILTLFRLVKNIADFPKVIYVLAYDRPIVADALSKVHTNRGYEFLEKIVQVSFTVPKIRQSDLYRVFKSDFEQIVSNFNNNLFDSEHFEEVLSCLFGVYITNMRDCNRVLNSFAIKYNMKTKNYDIGDLLGVTVIDLYEQDAYRIIMNNKYELCMVHDGIASSLDSKAAKALYDDIASAVKGDKVNFLKMFTMMFPDFMKAVNEADNTKMNIWTTGSDVGRINDIENFDNYFCLSLDDGIVDNRQVMEFLSGKSDDSVFVILKMSDREGVLNNLLQRACTVLYKRPVLTIEGLSFNNILVAISRLDLREKNRQYIPFKIKNLVHLLLKNQLNYGLAKKYKGTTTNDFDEEYKQNSYYRIDIMEFLSALINNSEINLEILLEIMLDMSAGHEWIYGGDFLKNESRILSEEEFAELKTTYVKRVIEESKNDSFLDNAELGFILKAWQEEDKASYDDYICKNKDVLSNI